MTQDPFEDDMVTCDRSQVFLTAVEVAGRTRLAFRSCADDCGKAICKQCGEGNFDQDDTTTRALNHNSAWSANLLSSTSTYGLHLISIYCSKGRSVPL
jgi:hypothetical protein